jgi:cell division protein FtsB
MDKTHSTSGDYAWAEASQARAENSQLRATLYAMEQQMTKLMNHMDYIVGAVNEIAEYVGMPDDFPVTPYPGEQ